MPQSRVSFLSNALLGWRQQVAKSNTMLPIKINLKRQEKANKLPFKIVGAISLRNRTFRSQHSSDYAIANRSYAN